MLFVQNFAEAFLQFLLGWLQVPRGIVDLGLSTSFHDQQIEKHVDPLLPVATGGQKWKTYVIWTYLIKRRKFTVTSAGNLFVSVFSSCKQQMIQMIVTCLDHTVAIINFHPILFTVTFWED